ncbi:conserved exported hypothetical protein [Tenacibaculum litopenaei]|uniref:hypothetical protein n=1 Tax=Tenacibaculum litopenaei TaxID=396016 RepID=UPI0038945314
MKKIIATLLCLQTLSIATAQQLENKVPKEADVVVSSNADNVFELIKMSDIDSSIIGESLLKKMNRKRKDDAFSSVGDMGVNINANAYYFYKKTDSVGYHGFMVELKDRAVYESTVKTNKYKTIEQERGFSYVQGYSNFTIWNDGMLLNLSGDRNRDYFKKHKARFEKLKEEKESNYRLQKRLTKTWVKEEAMRVMNLHRNQSIAVNSEFKKAVKKGAAMTFWMGHYGSFMGKMMESYGGMNEFSTMFGMIDTKNPNIYGIESISANLFFEENQAKVLMETKVSPSFQKSFKKIYGKRMDKNLLKGFDGTNVMAYWGMSVDTEAALNEYPLMLNSIYGAMFPKFKEEIDVAGGMVAMLLDEKAISELITGDALFVLNDFKKEKVSYTTYKYNEDYERTKVTKTKDAFVPDFTVMVGSKRQDMLAKLLGIGQKYKLVSKEAKVYKVDLPKSELPIDLYVVLKNEVLYVTSSKTRAFAIERGVSYNSGKHGKDLRKNATVVYLNPNRVLSAVPKNMIGKSNAKYLKFSEEHVQSITLKSERFRGNTMKAALSLNTTGKEENTLKLLLKMINTFGK